MLFNCCGLLKTATARAALTSRVRCDIGPVLPPGEAALASARTLWERLRDAGPPAQEQEEPLFGALVERGQEAPIQPIHAATLSGQDQFPRGDIAQNEGVPQKRWPPEDLSIGELSVERSAVRPRARSKNPHYEEPGVENPGLVPFLWRCSGRSRSCGGAPRSSSPPPRTVAGRQTRALLDNDSSNINKNDS